MYRIRSYKIDFKAIFSFLFEITKEFLRQKLKLYEIKIISPIFFHYKILDYTLIIAYNIGNACVNLFGWLPIMTSDMRMLQKFNRISVHLLIELFLLTIFLLYFIDSPVGDTYIF